MGKTVPSYRMALEEEIVSWKGFRNALSSDEEKVAFDEIMDFCRSNAMAGQNACNPILFEPMTMSILLGQQKRIQRLERNKSKIIEDTGRCIKLSRINDVLKGAMDIAVLLGKLQQTGWIKIIYDPKIGEEPLIQLTDKGKQLAISLLFSP